MKFFIPYHGIGVSWLSLLMFLPFLSLSQAINPYAKNYTVSDGLPSMECYRVIQDHSGYIWIATDRGVARFDGYSFTNFTTGDRLTDNVILHLFCDYKNRVWMAGLNGTICYAENGKILPYRFNNSLKKVFPKGGLITGFFCDEEDNLVLGISRLGILVMDATGNASIKYDSQGAYRSFLQTKSNIVFGYNFNSVTKGIKGTVDGKEVEIPYPDRLIKAHSYRGAVLPSGSIILPSTAKLLFIDFTHLPPAAYPCSDPPIFVYPESDSSVLISHFSIGGFSRLNWNRAKNAISQTHQYFTDVTVSSMCTDSAGGFWFTTLDNGLYYTPSFSTQLLSRSNALLSAQNLTGMAQQENGAPMFSTEKEIFVYRNDSVFLAPGQFQFKSEKPILNILISGNLLYVTRGGENRLLDLKKGYLPNKIDYHMNDFITDTSGIFITASACFQFNNSMQAIDNKKILPERCDAILKSADGKIWIGSVDGLVFLDKGLSPHFIDDSLLKGTRIKEIIELPNRNFIIAGFGKGLIFWDKKNAATLLDDPLNAELLLINTIAVDTAGIIWAGTNKGLYRISKNETGKYAVTKIGASDGIPLTDVRKICVYDGKVFLLCHEGVLIYDPRKDKSGSKPIVVYFESIKSGNEIFSSAGILNIPYDKRSLSIQYKGIDYSQFGKINYRYRFTGSDTSWKYTTNTQIDFPKLLAGNFTLQVAAKNSSNYWSKPSEFSFRIAPPFYTRWWFIMLCVIAIISITSWLIIRRNRIYFQKAQLQFAAQQRMNEMENQAKQAMMNPHFVFNALNSIQLYINDNDRVSANKYLTKFSRLIRLNLDLVNKNLITLEEEFEKLKLYLEIEQLRFGERLKYEFVISTELETDIIYIPSMILQPFVENAIWHGIMLSGKPGMITINAATFDNDQMLHLEVIDNGIGINQSRKLNAGKKRKSLGIQLTLDRLKLYAQSSGKEIKFETTDLGENDPAKSGTLVTIELPVSIGKEKKF
jgi:ligand-binding sensor domain-containing protein/anti-sigma regulatory factor (Ser/Thr protein kinase)